MVLAGLLGALLFFPEGDEAAATATAAEALGATLGSACNSDSG